MFSACFNLLVVNLICYVHFKMTCFQTAPCLIDVIYSLFEFETSK